MPAVIVGRAGGMRVPRVVGIESESDVAYAALQLMFVSELDRLAALPGRRCRSSRGGRGGAAGPRIFDSVGPIRLQLVAATPYRSGVVWLRYRPAGA